MDLRDSAVHAGELETNRHCLSSLRQVCITEASQEFCGDYTSPGCKKSIRRGAVRLDWTRCERRLAYVPQTERLSKIDSSLPAQPPYCAGICPVPPEQLVLFYGVDNSTVSRINLSNPTPEELVNLRTHVKEMNFATRFSVRKTDLIDFTRRELLRLPARNEKSSGIVQCLRERFVLQARHQVEDFTLHEKDCKWS
ncbi:hypothetical protein EDC04DRAFT_1762495 [Pisolithus marmoratus]|nr:hypothetical protein EDC04DRAFT_1762495 [Pisolithus marmoratus]